MTVTLPTGHTTQLYEGGRALYLPQSHLTYEARINGPEGTSYQQGTTSMQIAYVLGGSLESGHRPTVGGFGEQFWTSDPAEPPETPGKATGGGQIPGTDPTSPVSFGFEAISDEQADGSFRFQGRCAVEDRARNTSVRCLNVTSYTQVGNHATFRGEAEVNGQRTEYTIDVDDLGEPNSGRDTFKIVAGGYTAGGNVPSGNVQVFAPPGTPQG